MIARNASISIYGMYLWDSSLFDNMVLPVDKNGNPAFNKDDFTDNLVMELSEMECIYSDPDFMKSAIVKWSKKEIKVWQDLYNTTVLEYNPIWNKDGIILETHNLKGSNYRSGSDSTSYGKTDTSTYGRKDTSTYGKTNSSSTSQQTDTTYGRTDTTTYGKTETNTKGSTNTHNVAAFNEAAPHVQSTDVGSGSDTIGSTGTDSIGSSGTDTNRFQGASTNTAGGSDNVQASGSDTMQASGTDTLQHGLKEDTTDTGTIERKETGNIGITTTQSMIEEERRVNLFNIQDFIIKSFKQRFCLMTY